MYLGYLSDGNLEATTPFPIVSMMTKESVEFLVLVQCTALLGSLVYGRVNIPDIYIKRKEDV